MCVHRCSLVRECLRYYTVLRLALPRASVKDIAYNNILIPKGTVVFLNAWACKMGMLTLFSDSQMSAMWLINLFKDDEVWGPDADEFRPERWLEQPDAAMFTYGLGYRMCTGSILANREPYLIFIRLIHRFQIEKCDDVDCHPVLAIWNR
jgi:3-hydroxyphenylacetate 6-hydroxylase